MTNLTTATTILEQLGGNRFRAMTGASNFLGDSNSLTFKLPARSTKDGISHVRVELTPADVYSVTFFAIRGTKRRTVSICEGVYADQLQIAFTSRTGLDCTL